MTCTYIFTRVCAHSTKVIYRTSLKGHATKSFSTSRKALDEQNPNSSITVSVENLKPPLGAKKNSRKLRFSDSFPPSKGEGFRISKNDFEGRIRILLIKSLPRGWGGSAKKNRGETL